MENVDFYFTTRRILVLTLVFILLITVFYCFSAVFSSFGYKQSLRAHALEEGENKPVVNTPQSRITVVIDAGHGGADAGASANGLKEKDLNLQIALKLADFLRLSDVEVVLTRTEDILLYKPGSEANMKASDLRTRVDIAEGYENCIFVSIHMNKFPQESCRGLQVFYSANNPCSQQLAQAIQDSSKLVDPDNKRLIKKAGSNIFVLDRLEKPAVLVECGFLSNPSDAARLSDTHEQSKLAFAIFCGISSYLSVTDPGE